LFRIILSGWTIGKRFAGVRVVNANGSNLSSDTVLVREFVELFFNSSVFSPLIVSWTEDNASIVDLITNTRVIDLHADSLEVDNHKPVLIARSEDVSDIISPLTSSSTESSAAQPRRARTPSKPRRNRLIHIYYWKCHAIIHIYML
jgi:hypothetical protein